MKKTKKKQRAKRTRKSDKSDTIKKEQERTKEKRDLFLQGFSEYACNISATCKAVSISRETYYDWRRKYPEFAKACDDAEESMIDFAESKLMKQIDVGNMTAIIFFLTNKGKRRGWKNQYQLKHEGGDPDKPVRIVLQGVDLSKYPKAQETADSKQ
jgi:hypothetical protein